MFFALCVVENSFLAIFPPDWSEVAQLAFQTIRPLGIPTVRDRIEQAIVKNSLEPEWEAWLKRG